MRRVAVFLVVALSLSFLAAVGSLAIYSRVALSPEGDERLFREAGGERGARLYYHGEGGESISALENYTAVEWEEERIFSGEKYLYTPLSEIPKYLSDAFVAIEDHRFYRHGGVDVLRTGKAVLNSVFHFSPRFGGSTITQQLIKNIGGEKEQSAKRKLREMLRARALEKRHSKQEILEAYLNIVPMSDGCVGVAAGARLYFDKSPSELSLAEAASIAAVTRAPSVYAPNKNAEKHLSRRNTVLFRMKECGMIGEEEYLSACAEPLVLKNGIRGNEGVRSWYAEKVIEDVKNDLLSEGYSEAAASAMIYRGGLKIYTAMDKRAQEAAERVFSSDERFQGYEGLNAAFVLFTPDGRLAAYVGNRGRKEGNRLLSHAEALYAPGSALKPLALYAPALEDGKINEATVFDDVPSTFTGGAPWPRNSPDVYAGLTLCAEALALSKNTVAVSVYEMLGAERIYKALSDVGIDTLVRQRRTDRGILTDLAPAPLALGELTDGTSLFALTRAYLPLADGGALHSARSYLLVLDRDGEVLLSPKDEGERVYSPETASVLTHMLKSVTEEGSAASLSLPSLVETAGKTGTSAGGKNRIFIGYTPYYLGGVLCSYSDGRAVEGGVHLALFDSVMTFLHKDIPDPVRTFKMAKGLRAVRVCRDSGMLSCDTCRHDARGEREVTVWLKAEDIPREKCTTHRLFWYDSEGDGIVLDPSLYEDTRLSRVALLNVLRDFPVDIAVTDAEYTAREMGKTPPSEEDGAFYASLLPEGHYAGRRADGARPFNALSKRRGEAALPTPKEEENILPTPKEKDKPLPEMPKERPKRKVPRSRIFDFFLR